MFAGCFNSMCCVLNWRKARKMWKWKELNRLIDQECSLTVKLIKHKQFKFSFIQMVEKSIYSDTSRDIGPGVLTLPPVSIAVRLAVHHHVLRCLFCGEPDLDMHRVHGRWVPPARASRASPLLVFREDFGDRSLSLHLVAIYTSAPPRPHLGKKKDLVAAAA